MLEETEAMMLRIQDEGALVIKDGKLMRNPLLPVLAAKMNSLKKELKSLDISFSMEVLFKDGRVTLLHEPFSFSEKRESYPGKSRRAEGRS